MVGKGSLDDVLGVVHTRRLLGGLPAGQPLDLRALVVPLLVVHDGLPVLRALEALRQARVSMALVVDEYGEVEGVVTVEDVLEAVVGDMPERRLGEEPAIVRRQDGSMLMKRLLDRRGQAHPGPRQPAEEASYHTLARFILAQLGRVPEEGQSVVYDGWRFEVVDMDGRRIEQVLVRRSECAARGRPARAPAARRSADDAGALLGRGRRRDVGGRPQGPDDDDRDHHRPDDVPGPLVLKVHGWLPC